MSRSSLFRRLFLRAADPTRESSLSNRLRARRFTVIEGLIDGFISANIGSERPMRILDVGGTAEYWMQRSVGGATTALADDPRVAITLVNTEYHEYDGSHPRVAQVVGDGRDLRFADDEFDLVVSNSTMEHVGGREDQARMAREIQRVGKRCYVQVPCRWFPIEPHTGFPFFAVLPFKVKVWLIRHIELGHAGREDAIAAAEGRARDAHLLTASQTVGLFSARPVEVHRERVLGLTKSVAVVC